jgi:hypothetical protein
MTSQKSLIDVEKLINLFSLFVFGSISLVIYYLIPIPNFPYRDAIRFGLILVTILTYEFVFISVLAYYYTKGKTDLINDFNKDKDKYFVRIMVILGLTYLIINTYKTRDLLIFIRDLVMVVLVLVAIPQINGRFKKWWNKIGNKKVKKK